MTGDMLRRSDALQLARPTARRPSRISRLSLGKPKSTRLLLGLKDRLIFWMMVAVLHALSLLPDFILYQLGIACGLLFYRFDRRHPKIGMRNLAIAFPEKSEAERGRILRASYINLGRTGAEYVRLGGFFYRRLARRITYDRLDVWNELTPQIPRQGRTDPDRAFRQFRVAARRPRDARFSDRPGASYAALPGRRCADDVHPRTRGRPDNPQAYGGARGAALAQRGEIVGIPFDQNAKRSEAIWVPFFGEMAATTSGLARLAMMAGARWCRSSSCASPTASAT